MKTANFNSDSNKWEDPLFRDILSGNKVDQVIKVVTQFKPTEAGFRKFKEAISKSRGKWVRPIMQFIQNIEDGSYRREFKKTYGPHSQVSELFSFFRQVAANAQNELEFREENPDDRSKWNEHYGFHKKEAFLKKELQRIASEYPKTRKHLIPILKYAGFQRGDYADVDMKGLVQHAKKEGTAGSHWLKIIRKMLKNNGNNQLYIVGVRGDEAQVAGGSMDAIAGTASIPLSLLEPVKNKAASEKRAGKGSFADQYPGYISENIWPAMKSIMEGDVNKLSSVKGFTGGFEFSMNYDVWESGHDIFNSIFTVKIEYALNGDEQSFKITHVEKMSKKAIKVKELKYSNTMPAMRIADGLVDELFKSIHKEYLKKK